MVYDVLLQVLFCGVECMQEIRTVNLWNKGFDEDLL